MFDRQKELKRLRNQRYYNKHKDIHNPKMIDYYNTNKERVLFRMALLREIKYLMRIQYP